MFQSRTNRLIAGLLLVFFALMLVAHFRHPNKPTIASPNTYREVALGWLPDAKLTPGAPDPTITEETVCTTSTKGRRNVSAATKREVFREYGMSDNHSLWCDTDERCEVDHLCSLELGCTNDIKNLWPQPYIAEWNAHMKDELENRLHALMCSKQITMPEAQNAIISNWITAYKCMHTPDEASCMKRVTR